MLLPIRWLKDYLDINFSSKEIADKLTLSGSHVESIEQMEKALENIVVGKIINLEKHNDADRLTICQVNIGDKDVQIVTAATNMKLNDFVVVALEGANLPIGLKIEQTDFRGVASYGMFCSFEELGYDKSVISKAGEAGILILDKEVKPGTLISEALEFTNHIIDFEITPNRPDCLSIYGMARETSATFEIPLKNIDVSIKNSTEKIEKYFDSIEVNTDKCNRYYARCIKNVKIKPSPLWLQLRLMEAGTRPVNNIVDITNFCLLETGQPLHAFNLEKIDSRKIIVRNGMKDEIITTLDGEERTVNDNDILITDGNKAIAIGGVMGGENTEISDSTNLVLLEGANFDANSIRLTSKKLGLRTESSTRFEKGIDPNLAKLAVDRACNLIELLDCGEVVEGNYDFYSNKIKNRNIDMRVERCNKLLGTNLDSDLMTKYLNLLEINAKNNGKIINCEVPTFRMDIEKEVDLIEEVGRMFGFHNIISKPIIGELATGSKSYERILDDGLKNRLAGLGFNEILTYSFISPKTFDKINLDDASPLRNYVKILNPLGEDFSVMRTTLIPNVLEVFARNRSRNIKEQFVYEIGNIFFPFQDNLEPKELKKIIVGFYGNHDFYYLKEIVGQIFIEAGINDIYYVTEENNPTFHSGRCANILINDKLIGVIGQVNIDIAEKYGIKEEIYIAELDFDSIVNISSKEKKYKPLNKFPAVERDFAIIVDESVLYGDIESIIINSSKEYVESVNLFDIFRDEKLGENKKSIAFSVVFRAQDRTLNENEILEFQNKVIGELAKKTGGILRS